MRSPVGAASIAVLVLLATPAAAHGLINLNVVVPPECPGEQTACLTTIEAQPRLHSGDEVSFFVYNDDRVNHTLHVATNASRTAEGSGSRSDALASAGPVPANGSIDGGEFAIPEDADALYVWCSQPGHEVDGEHLVVALSEPPEGDRQGTPIPGLWALGVAVLAASALRREA